LQIFSAATLSSNIIEISQHLTK